MLSTNKWHHRKVAEKAAKPCWICYKLSSSVLITPDDKDFFYVCPGHLKDKKFCQPDADELKSIAERKVQWDIDQEAKKFRTEHADESAKGKEEDMKKKVEEEEKQKKEGGKDGKKDGKDDGKNAAGKSGEGEGKEASGKKEENSPTEDEKGSKGSEAGSEQAVFDGEPRIFALQRNFFQMRIDRLRNAELARKNKERLQTPGAFPSVPSGNP